MPEVRLRIDDEFMDRLRVATGQDLKATDILREALTTYNWAVTQRRHGRVILSGTEEGVVHFRLAQPSLDAVPTDPTAVKELLAATAPR